MLVITHKIFNEELRFDTVAAAVPNDSIGRCLATLPLQNLSLKNGESLLNSLEPIEYCLDTLRWHDLLTLSPDEVKKKLYNPGLIKLLPFNPAATFTPYLAITP
jgi:hypothetical protein